MNGLYCCQLLTGIIVAGNDKTIIHVGELLKRDGSVLLSTFPNVAGAQ